MVLVLATMFVIYILISIFLCMFFILYVTERQVIFLIFCLLLNIFSLNTYFCSEDVGGLYSNIPFLTIKNIFLFLYNFLYDGGFIIIVFSSCFYFLMDLNFHSFFYSRFIYLMLVIRHGFFSCLSFFPCFTSFFISFFHFSSCLLYFVTLPVRRLKFNSIGLSIFSFSFFLDPFLCKLEGESIIKLSYGDIFICNISSSSLLSIISFLNKVKIFNQITYIGKIEYLNHFVSSVFFALSYGKNHKLYDQILPSNNLNLKHYFSTHSDLFDFVFYLNQISSLHLSFKNNFDFSIVFDDCMLINGLKLKIIQKISLTFFFDLILKTQFYYNSFFRERYLAFIFCFYSFLFYLVSGFVSFWVLFLYYALFVGYMFVLLSDSMYSIFLILVRIVFCWVFFIYFLCLPFWSIPIILWFVFYNPIVFHFWDFGLHYVLFD